MQQTDTLKPQLEGTEQNDPDIEAADGSVCELRSLKSFLAGRSRSYLERCSERVVDTIRERDISLNTHRQMLVFLDQLSPVSKLTFFNAILAKAIYISETEDTEERVRFLEEFFQLLEKPLEQRACLEVLCRLFLNCISLDLPQSIRSRLPYSFLKVMEHPKSSPTIRELSAGGLFNLFFQMEDQEEEKHFLDRFITVCRNFMQEEKVTNLLLKTLVNYSHKLKEPNEKRQYLAVMREFAAIPSSGDENQLVFAKGLSNYIMFLGEAEMEEKLRELANLRQMIRGERFWNYAETYVHTIFKTSIDTETLEIKRHFFREYQSILSIRNDGPASFRETAAQFLFNHFVDVPEIEEKREVLEEMLFLWKMNENDTNVTREIARLLVNLIIDEPEESKKRAYFMLMERLATLFPANFEIQLEYAKALVNFSICESPVNEKMEFLKKLFALREKLETPSVQNRQADILTDFLCIYAQGILIFVTLVKDPVQRQESLEQLPPIAKFKKSLFMDVFRSVLKDLLRMETEGPLRRKLEEYMQEAET